VQYTEKVSKAIKELTNFGQGWVLAFCLLLLLLAGSQNMLPAQSLDPHFINYTVKDGLPSNEINAIVQDKKGYVWVGTSNGLVRFDGYNFISFDAENDTNGLTDKNVRNLALHPDGHIWVGYYSAGVRLIHAETGEVILHMHEQQEDLRLLDNRILGFTQEGDSLLHISVHYQFIQTYNLKTKKLKAYPNAVAQARLKNKYVNVVHKVFTNPMKPNTSWITTSSGLIKWHRKTNWFERKIFKADTNSPPQCNQFIANSFLGDSAMLLSTWGAGLIYYHIKKDEWQEYVYSSERPLNGKRNVVLDLVAKSDHEFWVATLDRNLGVFSLKDGKFRFFTHRPDDPFSTNGYSVRALLKDYNDGLWLGTRGGLSYMHPNNTIVQEYFLRPPLKEVAITNYVCDLAISLEKKKMLLAYRDDTALYKLNLKTGAEKAIPIFTNKELVRCLLPVDTGYFLATYYSGLYFWKPGLKKPIRVSQNTLLKTAQIFKASFGANGWLALASNNHGLLLYNTLTDSLRQFLPQEVGLNNSERPNGFFSAFFDDAGNLWGGSHNGAFYFNLQTGEQKTLNAKNDGFNAKFVEINDFFLDQSQQVWAKSSNNGLFALHANDSGIAIVKRYSEDKGLPSNVIKQAVSDTSGYFYLKTPLGIQVYNPITQESLLLNAQNGVKRFNQASSLIFSADGYLNLGEPGRLYRISKEKISTLMQAKARSLWLSELSTISGKMLHPESNSIQLNYNASGISFGFSNLFFGNPTQIKYAYRILELDSAWRSATLNKGTFTSLPPGDYTLQARATQPNGIYGQPKSLLKIHVTPPYWQTWWFRALIASLIVSLIYIFYRLRIGQFKRESALKADFSKRVAEVKMEALRAQMNPHFLFNSLNSINYYILQGQTETASDYLAKFSSLLRQVLAYSRQDKITLAQELSLLELYCQLESMRFGDTFNYRLLVDDNLNPEHYVLPPMVIQPYVENAIWHGLLHKQEGTKVLYVRFLEEKKKLKVIIDDNGIGREKAGALKSKTATSHKSLGMEITKERFLLIKQNSGQDISAEVLDKTNNQGQPTGTQVTLLFGQPSSKTKNHG
jgi:ligand-binding sensor domain-containing protein